MLWFNVLVDSRQTLWWCYLPVVGSTMPRLTSSWLTVSSIWSLLPLLTRLKSSE